MGGALNTPSSVNLAILRQRYLLNRATYRVLLPLIETTPALASTANRACFKLDRLAATLLTRTNDPPFLQFCGEVELCAMSGLIEIDEELSRTLFRFLRPMRFRQNRDVLPQLLLRRLQGRGLVLESPAAGAFVADLLELSESVSAGSSIWSFFANPQHAARILSERGALAHLVAESEDDVPTGPHRAALGFTSLLEFLQDFLELIEDAGEPYLQSALWHQHADLLDQVLVYSSEIERLFRLLYEQPEINAMAVEAAHQAQQRLLHSEAWESVLLEALGETRASAAAPAELAG